MVSALILDFEVAHLEARHCEVRDLECECDWHLLELFAIRRHDTTSIACLRG